MERSPHDYGVVPDAIPRHWGNIGESAEELHLVGGAHRVAAFASQTEGVRLWEGVGQGGLEDRVDVTRRFRFPMGLEEAKHLVALQRLPPHRRRLSVRLAWGTRVPSRHLSGKHGRLTPVTRPYLRPGLASWRRRLLPCVPMNQD